MVAQPYLPQGGAADGQLWMQSHIISTFKPVPPAAGINPQVQRSPHDVEKLREEMQQTKSHGKQIQNLLCSSSRSVIGSTSLANSGRSKILLFLSSLSSLNSRPSSWILDSGAIDHTTPISNIVVSYETMLF